MTASYRLTETAEDEIGEILMFIAARDGVDRALHVHTEFVETFARLARMPDSGSKRPDLTGVRVRWWTVLRWVVIYDPESTPLTVLRVIDGARALESILGQAR